MYRQLYNYRPAQTYIPQYYRQTYNPVSYTQFQTYQPYLRYQYPRPSYNPLPNYQLYQRYRQYPIFYQNMRPAYNPTQTYQVYRQLYRPAETYNTQYYRPAFNPVPYTRFQPQSYLYRGYMPSYNYQSYRTAYSPLQSIYSRYQTYTPGSGQLFNYQAQRLPFSFSVGYSQPYQSYSPGMYGFQTGYNMVPSSSYYRDNLPAYGSFGYSQVRPGYAFTGVNQPGYFSLGYQPGFQQYQTFNLGYQPGFQQYQRFFQPGYQLGQFGNRNLYNTGYQFGYTAGPAYGYQMGYLGNRGYQRGSAMVPGFAYSYQQPYLQGYQFGMQPYQLSGGGYQYFGFNQFPGLGSSFATVGFQPFNAYNRYTFGYQPGSFGSFPYSSFGSGSGKFILLE